MPLEIEARGVVSDAAARIDSERIAFFDGLCRLQSGDILCGYTVGSMKHCPKGTIRFSRSTDGGETWSEIPFKFDTVLDGVPGSLAGAELAEVSPGRLLLVTTWFDRSDPAKPLFDPVTEGILHSKLLMAVSEDHGMTWGPWQPIQTPGLTGVALTGPWLVLPNGTLGLAFESFKEFDDPSPARHGAWLLCTHDGGHTFDVPYCVGQDPQDAVYYWDQRVIAVPPQVEGAGNDEYVALFWTHHRKDKHDLKVHFLKSRLRGTHADMQPVVTTIPGQIAAPYVARDGRIFGFVVDRDHPGTMTLWQSSDGGATWPDADKLVVYTHQVKDAVSQGKENVDFAQYWEDMGKWSFGHPAIVGLDDNHVLVSYYAGTPQRMSVHWARVRI
jgi:hypothetical protein